MKFRSAVQQFFFCSPARRIFLFAVLLIATALAGCSLRTNRFAAQISLPLAPSETLVIGFQGGRQSWNSKTEGVTRLAESLRQRRLENVSVVTLENQARPAAIELIRRGLDRNRDGTLISEEKAAARIVIYGQSFGGAAVVKLARHLDELQIPVLLTVQVDSVGWGDGVIPPNVRKAANIYQTEGLLIRGEAPIRAAHPGHTRILGNYEVEYREREVDVSQVPWWRRLLREPHSKMNVDPEVWGLVERLIVAELSNGNSPQSKEKARVQPGISVAE